MRIPMEAPRVPTRRRCSAGQPNPGRTRASAGGSAGGQWSDACAAQPERRASGKSASKQPAQMRPTTAPARAAFYEECSRQLRERCAALFQPPQGTNQQAVGNARSLPAVAGGVPEVPVEVATSTRPTERVPPRVVGNCTISSNWFSSGGCREDRMDVELDRAWAMSCSQADARNLISARTSPGAQAATATSSSRCASRPHGSIPC